MIFEKVCGFLGAAIMVASISLPIGSSNAQDRATDGICKLQTDLGSNSVAERIVLHDLHFQGRSSQKIDNAAAAVLDYAARSFKHQPHSIICVEISRAPSEKKHRTELQNELANRRVLAVTSYLQQKGVDADKLVFVFPAAV